MSEQKQASYEDFRGQWLKEHPHSQPQMEQAALTPRWLKASILLVWVCAAVVSGAHTVPTMAKTIPYPDTREAISLLSFVMVEGAMFIAMYMRALNRGRLLLWSLIGLTTIVAVAGNLYSTFDTLKPAGAVAVVGLLVGVAAPLVTLMGGELFATLKTVDDGRQRRAKEAYDEKWRELDARVLGAWNKARRGEEAAVERLSSPAIDLNLIKSNQISSRNRPSPRLERAKAWLEAHPEHWNTAPRELEAEIGVSYGTIFTAQKQLKAGQNGTGEISDGEV